MPYSSAVPQALGQLAQQIQGVGQDISAHRLGMAELGYKQAAMQNAAELQKAQLGLQKREMDFERWQNTPMPFGQIVETHPGMTPERRQQFNAVMDIEVIPGVKLRDYPTTPKSINQVFNEFSQEQNRQQRFTEEQTARKTATDARQKELELRGEQAQTARDTTLATTKAHYENVLNQDARQHKERMDLEDAKRLDAQGWSAADITKYTTAKTNFAMDYADKMAPVIADENNSLGYQDPDQLSYYFQMGLKQYDRQMGQTAGPGQVKPWSDGGTEQPSQFNEANVQQAMDMLRQGMTPEQILQQSVHRSDQ